MKKNSTSVVSNLIWKFSEGMTTQLVTLVVSIILARLLEPTHYGVISIVMIFITLANVFVSDGFGSALIQKKDSDSLDYSSVLYFNITLSVILYLVLFFAAPYISKFYGKDFTILTPVLRVLSLRLILSSINSIQQAYISKHMMFRMFFISTSLGTVTSAFVGIGMAYAGYGVWALVAQYLTNTTMATLILAITLGKWPKPEFSYKRLKSLFRYGANILGTNLLIAVFQEIRALIIGKIYTSSDLAFYDKGRQFPSLTVTSINTAIGAVLFPKISMNQDDIQGVKDITRKSIRLGSYVLFPIMLGLAATSTPLVRVILTDKWLPCVPFLQAFCIIYLFQPIHTANLQAIKAIGRSDIFLKLEVIKKVIEIAALLLTMWKSVNAIVISLAIVTALFTFVNAYPNKKLLNYSFAEQVNDMLPALLMSAAMAVIVYLLSMLSLNIFVMLVAQILLGVSVYLLLSIASKNPEFWLLVRTIKINLLSRER